MSLCARHFEAERYHGSRSEPKCLVCTLEAQIADLHGQIACRNELGGKLAIAIEALQRIYDQTYIDAEGHELRAQIR